MEKAEQQVLADVTNIDQGTKAEHDGELKDQLESAKQDVALKKLHEKTTTAQVDNMTGHKIGVPIILKNGEEIRIIPVSLSDAPKLSAKVFNVNELVGGDKEIINDASAKLIAEVAYMGDIEGHKKEKTVTNKKKHKQERMEWLLDNLSLGDFPKIFDCVLDVNDFFVGMRKIQLKMMLSVTSMMNLAGQKPAQTTSQE